MKNCIKCDLPKELDKFYKSKKHKDGYFNICKICNKEKYIENREKKLNYQNEYIKNNLKKVFDYNRKYSLQNKEKSNLYYIQNKEKYKESNKIWREKNKEKLKKQQREYNRNKYKNCIQFKLKSILRSRFYFALKNNKKSKSILKLIGCNINELKIYLEQQFKPEMNWENHGLIWEIDHIISCASFDLNESNQQNQCFHYTNLQPLFKTTDIAKIYGYENEIGNKNKTK